MSVIVKTLSGEAFKAALPELARLRIEVFHDWPYLYDGTLEYEQGYLSHFAKARDAVIAVAMDGERIVGAATASPLLEHTSEFAPLFEARGYDPARVFYFGESVLKSGYRGRGLGHAFFDAREAAARAARTPKGETYQVTAFCGVVRPADHPQKPAGYRPLDAFWQKRGYTRIDGMLGSYSWKDIGTTEETSKPMQFWVRPL